jgi:hypothetical protein
VLWCLGGATVVASLEETQGLLSRFDCVYLGYTTQGCEGVALAGWYEPTCQVLLFPYTRASMVELDAQTQRHKCTYGTAPVAPFHSLRVPLGLSFVGGVAAPPAPPSCSH